jgi:hypothetical protein
MVRLGFRCGRAIVPSGRRAAEAEKEQGKQQAQAPAPPAGALASIHQVTIYAGMEPRHLPTPPALLIKLSYRPGPARSDSKFKERHQRGRAGVRGVCAVRDS